MLEPNICKVQGCKIIYSERICRSQQQKLAWKNMVNNNINPQRSRETWQWWECHITLGSMTGFMYVPHIKLRKCATTDAWKRPDLFQPVSLVILLWTWPSLVQAVPAPTYHLPLHRPRARQAGRTLVGHPIYTYLQYTIFQSISKFQLFASQWNRHLQNMVRKFWISSSQSNLNISHIFQWICFFLTHQSYMFQWPAVNQDLGHLHHCYGAGHKVALDFPWTEEEIHGAK